MTCEEEKQKLIQEFITGERCLSCGEFKDGTPEEKQLTSICWKCFENS